MCLRRFAPIHRLNLHVFTANLPGSPPDRSYNLQTAVMSPPSFLIWSNYQPASTLHPTYHTTKSPRCETMCKQKKKNASCLDKGSPFFACCLSNGFTSANRENDLSECAFDNTNVAWLTDDLSPRSYCFRGWCMQSNRVRKMRDQIEEPTLP
jgi:hypothetical protein